MKLIFVKNYLKDLEKFPQLSIKDFQLKIIGKVREISKNLHHELPNKQNISSMNKSNIKVLKE